MQIWLPRPAVRGPLRRWLTARGSLSERIRSHCGAGFRVRPLLQEHGHAWLDEAVTLGLAGAQPTLVREVLLYCGDTPVVFARSLAATKHLDGPWRALRGLGSRPLASMLFAEPRIDRGALAYGHLDRRSRLHRRAAAMVPGMPELPTQLWARRSVFRREGAPLLVTEVFLPGILAL